MKSNKIINNRILFLIAIILSFSSLQMLKGENGYELWLNYREIENIQVKNHYLENIQQVIIENVEHDPVLMNVLDEIKLATRAMIGEVKISTEYTDDKNSLVIGTPASSQFIRDLYLTSSLDDDGFVIKQIENRGKKRLVIASPSSRGALYGTFYFIRLMQMHQPFDGLHVKEKPDIDHRIIQHWDNLNGTVERGYAGRSLWQWDELPEKLSPRYTDYLRANASIGINGIVINNVNADPHIISALYIKKLAALASLFRSYGQKMYVCLNFDSPKHLGKLSSSDPMKPEVKKWWQSKVDEIYREIPDFGGGVIKADSEGQPGPKKYDVTPAEVADIFSKMLEPYNGILLWRTFAGAAWGTDRCQRDYDEYKNYNNRGDNVMLLAKYGPHDFHVNEPFHPLLSKLDKTNFGLETQTANEHRGQANNIFYNGMLWRDYLDRDTYRNGQGLLVKDIYKNQSISAWVNVAGLGMDSTWTGNHMNQLNWYASGMFSWNLESNPREIAKQWARLTFGNDKEVVATISNMMINSWEARKKLTGPLGLMKITLVNQYTPIFGEEDKVPHVFNFHRSDKDGTGFRLDKDTMGTSNGRAMQYPEPLKQQFGNIESCPDQWVAWFHHVPYDHKLHNGNTAIEEIYQSMLEGYQMNLSFYNDWKSLGNKIDAQRYTEQLGKMWIQVHHASTWLLAAFPYYEKLSGIPHPDIPIPAIPGDMYEAENAQVDGTILNGMVAKRKLGFASNNAYLDFPSDTSKASWNININEPGMYYLVFKYHTPGVFDTKMQVQIDKENPRLVELKYLSGHHTKDRVLEEGKIYDENTGSYWGATAIVANMEKGDHQIMIENVGKTVFNLDCIVLIK